MKYRDLFNEIQLSRDYLEDKRTGVNWRYNVNKTERRVFIELQETKTLKDWLFNFMFLPVPFKTADNKTVWVTLGFLLMAKAAFDYILIDYDVSLKEYAAYDWFLTGWSQGAAVPAIIGNMLKKAKGVKVHYIGYGCPAFCFGKKSVKRLFSVFETCISFLYERDWIKHLIPFCRRIETVTVKPWNEPKNLDQRHRVYSKADYVCEKF